MLTPYSVRAITPGRGELRLCGTGSSPVFLHKVTKETKRRPLPRSSSVPWLGRVWGLRVVCYRRRGRSESRHLVCYVGFGVRVVRVFRGSDVCGLAGGLFRAPGEK